MGVGTTRRATRKGAQARAVSRPGFEVTEAKLFRPPIRPGIVRRNVLVDRLRASTAPVVAITAPAGYGKTTLLAEWAERDRRPFAWVSIDEADGDPVVFLGHVAVALDRVESIDPGVFEAIASPTGSSPRRVLSRLGSALSTRTRPFVLVLDDVDRLSEPLADGCGHDARRLRPGGFVARPVRPHRPEQSDSPGSAPTVGCSRSASTTSPWGPRRRTGSFGVPGSGPPRPRRPSSPTRPRDGRSACTSPRCPCRSSGGPPCHRSGSPATIASSSTTSAPRSSGPSPGTGSASSSGPRSSIASTGRCATRSWSGPAPPAPSSRSSARTSSWSRSIVSASGTATTICSATCFGRSSHGANPTRSRSCIGGPRTVSRKPGCSRRPSCTRTRAATRSGLPSCSNAWVSRTTGTGGAPPSVVGSTCSGRTWSPATGGSRSWRRGSRR